jgi:hypothetical protein
MVSAARTVKLHSHPDWPKTLEEFRAWHERQPDVWEFIHGTPKLMAPGSMAHTLIGRKLALYLKVPALHHYLLVEQDRRQIVHHERRDDLGGVFLANVAPPDPLRLDPPGIEISLAALYEGVP